jgi:hypothetical protein
MSDHRGTEPRPANAARALEVLRLRAGQSVIVRMLSERIDGCQTHYVKNRTQYCPGDADCPPLKHKEEMRWKGYVAAESWEQASGLWIPTVLEITERFERDVRLTFARGQVWELIKRVQTQRHKHPPLEGRLLETLAAEGLPLEFDVLPTLEVLFNFPGMRLGVENPLSARVMVSPSVGAPPAKFAPPPTPKPDPAHADRYDFKKAKERLGKGVANGIGHMPE